MIKILEGEKIWRVSLLKQGNQVATTPGESLDMLLSTAFPAYKEGGGSDDTQVNTTQQGDKEALLDYIDVEKVKAAVMSFGPRKAAGPDGWPPLVLQSLPEEYISYMVEMYKESYRTGVTPRSWREMKVVFIPKVGKDSYSSPKSYRPITLSNFVLKVMERLIQWFLTDEVLQLPLLGQHAYMTGRSTETALSEVVDAMEKMIHRKKYLLAVSLDCSGAFDNIRFDSARRAMEQKGVDPSIISWYDNMLRGREVTAELQGEKKTFRPTRGSPQGGVLSPLIWILIMDSLLQPLQQGSVRAVGYADDVLLMVEGLDPSTMGELMQEALGMVEAWSEEHGLTFNPTKTQAMLGLRARGARGKLPPNPVLTLGGVRLNFAESIRYLGVLINRRLIWSQHIKERYRKCVAIFHKTKALIAKDWGLTPKRVLWVYKAIVLPKHTYAALIWGHEVNKTAGRWLKRLQRMALSQLLRPWKTTAADSLEVIADMMPVDLLIQELATKARLRTGRGGRQKTVEK